MLARIRVHSSISAVHRSRIVKVTSLNSALVVVCADGNEALRYRALFVWAEKMYPGTIHTGGIVYGTIVATAFSATIFTAWPHLMPDNYAVSRRSRSVRRRAPMTNYPTTTSNPASRFFSGMLTIVAFFISMVWMDFVAGEVVSLLTAAGKICNISEALLGATVLPGATPWRLQQPPAATAARKWPSPRRWSNHERLVGRPRFSISNVFFRRYEKHPSRE